MAGLCIVSSSMLCTVIDDRTALSLRDKSRQCLWFRFSATLDLLEDDGLRGET